MEDNLISALNYAGHGLKIFPVWGLEKPEKAKQPVYTGGYKIATNDQNKILELWKDKNFSIGIATGTINNIVVVDIDNPEAIEYYKNYIATLPTTIVKTVRGIHLYYKINNLQLIKSNVRTLGDFIDIRGEGGYVVAPPSDGYHWINEESTILNSNLPQLPKNIVETLAPIRINQPTTPPQITHQTAPQSNETTPPTNYASNALNYEISNLLLAQEGTRNSTLNKTAYSLFQLVASGLLDGNLVINKLMEAGEQIGLEFDEINKTINSAKAGINTPRDTTKILALNTKENETTKVRTERNKFKFTQAGSLPEVTEDDWLVKNIIPKNSMGCLYGESGSYKTFTALSLGLAVANGTQWHGTHQAEQGTVLYLCGEGLTGVKKRILAWCILNNIDIKKTNFFVSNRPALINDTEDAQALQTAIQELKEAIKSPISLIIIDTLARNFKGSENDSESMGRFVYNINELMYIFKCGVLVVHHTGLQENKRARGSSVLKCSVDYEIIAEKTNGFIKISNTKQKDFIKFEDTKLEIKQINTTLGQSCVIV